ncbi:DNA polymerase III subunit alpha [Aliikangiella marina]|uniref:Error-prone DNA polymerase n=1 Tax=Aliikangiella marina TaxID=1712262 RepID=A0A545TJA3_9GAMM|nr:error-prone DNA polymerase [Aliikangiella marina]TQV77310.1 DNA polymerase III subunit alpha [Aliikangiella marina]
MQYYELNTTTNFSFLTGASHPEELVETAIKLGYSGIAITDECSLAGVVRAHVATKAHNQQSNIAKLFHLIIGSRFTIAWNKNFKLQLILLCPCREAYAELSSLITLARRRAEKGDYQVELKDFALHISRCLAIWIPTNNFEISCKQLKAVQDIFANRLWVGYQRLLTAEDYFNYTHCFKLAKQFQLPVVAQNAILMHDKKRLRLQHCLTAIRNNCSVQNLGKKLIANAEQHLRSLHRLSKLYPSNLLIETQKVADLCHFSLDELRYEYPDEILPKEISPSDYLRQLVEDGAKKRWPNGILEKVNLQIEYELSVINKLKYEHYFLTVFDIVQFARSKGILCQGRGSAANSAVCYCLFITEVDPAQSDLLFERFISEERDEPPDIDVDFEHQRREEVIQYIYKKYSRERAALAATVVTYRLKSAIRDIGKALGIDEPIVDYLSKSLAWWDKPQSLQKYFDEINLTRDGLLANHFFELVMSILRFPRHLSQHVGGFIITQRPMSHLVPVENATMADRTVIQWDKYDIEALGLLKIDVLGLGMLTMIRKCLQMTANYSDIKNLQNIPKEDPLTYKMLCNADTVGVFQIESRAQMSMLPRLKPQCFYDLVIQIAIVRPGPIQGNMVHPYLKRRNGEIPTEYPNEEIKQVLKRTLGVPIFQEQVIKLAMVAAGFSGGQADQLRRAMASWGRNGDLYQFQDKLINGMLARGYSRQYAERVFEQMKGFGSYGFPESHSASFAILAYFSSWLKRHHTAAFYCALLNSQPMGFYSPSQLIQDAKRHRIIVLAVDVDYSQWDSLVIFKDEFEQQTHQYAQLIKNYPTDKPIAIRLGMHLVKGFNQDAANRLCAERKVRQFSNIKDLVFRGKLNATERDALVRANTLPRLAEHRYQAQWQSLAIEENKPLLTQLDAEDKPSNELEDQIQPPTLVEDVMTDYQTLGLTLNQHPLAILRSNHWIEKCKKADQLKSMQQGQFVKVAGVVTCRQRPGTAAGVLFLTLEDETGNMNIIVWKNTVEKFRKPIMASRLLLIKGKIERERKVVHVIAGYIEDISDRLPEFRRHSRDFH